jgi:glycerate 2-kinase
LLFVSDSDASYPHRAADGDGDGEVVWRTLRSTMRVLVISAGIAGLDPGAAGSAVGSAWADLGHQVAVVPIGIGGSGLVAAVSTIPGAVVVTPGPGESSAQVGLDLAAARDADTILVDLTGDCPDDGGAGLVSALGGLAVSDGAIEVARSVVTGRTLVAVVSDDELEAPLLGVRGVAARRTYTSGKPDIGAALAGNAVLARLAADLGMLEPPPGAGAGNGLALAILALGGVVRTGPAAIGELVGIERSLAAADLVVILTEALDFGGAGVAETRAGAAWAERALVPCVAVAASVRISGRELRTLGVESAYEVGAEVTSGAARIARTWNW